ncbi:DNA-binding response regulator, partial [Streptomyces sp. PTM05]
MLPTRESLVPQVAIVERNTLVCRGWESLLSRRSQVRLSAVACEPSALTPARGGGYDVIVYGVPQNCRAFTEKVETLVGQGRVLVLMDLSHRQPVTGVLRLGAFGCVDRRAGESEVLSAVETVAEGGIHVAAGLAGRLHAELRQFAAPGLVLARREAETLRWLA